MNNKSIKNYRPNVAAVILSPKYPQEIKIFIAQRTDLDNVWQFPQGGIDEGETPKEALFRELKEEIGTNDIEILAEYPEWLEYDFPDVIAKKMYPYDGQRQKYFLVRLKDSSKITLDTQYPEFNKHKFVDVKDVYKNVTYFKKVVYKSILKYFKKEGYL
jgi:putative (di)nucleoside polyphosphate hydrolase